MSDINPRLGRQIIRSVVITSMSSVILTVVSMYLIYGILIRVAPKLVLPDNEQWMPAGIEWFIIGFVCLIAAILAAIAATGLARSIVAPVVSVAQNARRIADGDLSARAVSVNGSLSGLSMLVDDFNLLAERLEAASEGVTRWNATIAHELRTPVTILRGRLQGLADGVFKPEPQLLRSLEAQVTSLSALIDDLRTVTLFDAGQLRADLRETDLAEVVEATIQLMRPELEKAGLILHTSIEPSNCVADSGRVRQAVLALLENARRHADPGPVHVTLARRADEVHLEVRDSGPGLPPDFEEHAFDPFRRYMEQGIIPKGSGLGLSVVRAIAEIHAGTAVYRRIDGGASFLLTIPCRPQI